MKEIILPVFLFFLIVYLHFMPCSAQIYEDMVLVKDGAFIMGSKLGAPSDEKPVHPVTVDSFFIGKYEVTQQEWQAVMGNNPSLFKARNLPVDQVTWYDAVEYCNKRSQKEGLQPCYKGSGDNITCDFAADGYRLPTEAEWEYAARGGPKSRDYTYSGSDNAEQVAWFEKNSGYISHPVGEKKPNELGIHDMSGNIWEWCWDWYEEDYYIKSPQSNPAGPAAMPVRKHRCYRGGGFGGTLDWLRITGRYSLQPSYKRFDMGFRVIRKAYGQCPGNMVLVAGGTFPMGSKEGSSGEIPQHKITLTGYYIGKYEVTQAEWLEVMGYNPSSFPGAACPVENVSWFDAVEYCNKRSRLEGLIPCYAGRGNNITCNFTNNGYRLPTEAEWEYACRGGCKSHGFEFSGSNNTDEVGWDNKTGRQSQPVGEKKANELGIFDMSGNVAEWCWDWYEPGYYRSSPPLNPQGPAQGMRRVVRGGCFFFPEERLRCTAREKFLPLKRTLICGFRVVRTAK